MGQSGTLYIVATPIGNLKDITLRAVDTLKSVDMIACEDTRRTGILLKAYEIQRPVTSYHSYSPLSKRRRILEELKSGKQIAVVSDAGLPGISDPGSGLVQDAISAGINVTVIPGASATLMGLILSGFPTERFVFEAFLPVKPGPRHKRLEALKAEPRTVVIYESPHRLMKTLSAIQEVFGDIQVACSRELTKRFEETRREKVSVLHQHFSTHSPRGEFVLVIPPKRLRSNGKPNSS